MSQTANSAKKKPILQRPGCLFGILGAFIGVGGLIILGLLLAGYSFYQITNEGTDLLEAPEIEALVGESPDAENPAPALEQESELPGEAAGPFFTLADCQCGVPLPFNENLSSVSSNRSGMQVEVDEVLTCDWSEKYASERVTSELTAYLEVFKLTKAEDAQTLFEDFLDEILAFAPYCSDDQACTIAVSEVSDQYAFYVEKHTFIRGDGVEFPSGHHGYIAAMDSSSSGDLFAWRLSISHPELELGGTWVEDTSQTISACVIFDIVN